MLNSHGSLMVTYLVIIVASERVDEEEAEVVVVVVVVGGSRTRRGIRFPLFLSQKSIPPAILPYPPQTINRPCGDISMVLRWARPNKKVGSDVIP
jgi:hypothetical protein